MNFGNIYKNSAVSLSSLITENPLLSPNSFKSIALKQELWQLNRDLYQSLNEMLIRQKRE